MNWHTTTVPSEGLGLLLARIRSEGGTVACSRPGADGVLVTWTSPAEITFMTAPSAGRQ